MRLDLWLVKNNKAASREQAQRMIKEGLVVVSNRKETKPSSPVPDDAVVTIHGALPFVSRGGEKLTGALDRFDIAVAGLRCLDVGASTGGFTDCLLQRGAAHVTAVDVGHGQMDPRVAADPRVDSREGVNARNLSPADFADLFGLVVVDLSFISLAKVLEAVAALTAPAGWLLCLVKPQFEAGREHVGAGGIVRDAKVHEAVLIEHVRLLAGLGRNEIHLARSPIAGKEGNTEFWSVSRQRTDGALLLPDATEIARLSDGDWAPPTTPH